MRLRSRPTVVTACVAAALMTLAGCGSGEGEGTDTTASSSSSNSSSASSEPTYDEAHIMAEVRAVEGKLSALGPNDTIPKGADWVTDEYRRTYNEQITAAKDAGVVLKGKATSESVRLATSDPDAPGGWDLSVYQCTRSTVRAYKDGADVSKDPHRPGEPLPKGDRVNAYLQSFTTPDGGKTWRLDDSKLLTGSDAKKARCGA